MLLEKEKKEMDYLVNVMMTNFELYEQIYLNDNVFEVPGVQQFKVCGGRVKPTSYPRTASST